MEEKTNATAKEQMHQIIEEQNNRKIFING